MADIMIPVAYGNGEINLKQLVAFFISQPNQTVMIGGENVKLAEHRHPYSLDYWIRTHGAERSDTRQTSEDWIREHLLSTGYFEETSIINAETGRSLKALRLVKQF